MVFYVRISSISVLIKAPSLREHSYSLILHSRMIKVFEAICISETIDLELYGLAKPFSSENSQ
jgi:hypothetical protein